MSKKVFNIFSIPQGVFGGLCVQKNGIMRALSDTRKKTRLNVNRREIERNRKL